MTSPESAGSVPRAPYVNAPIIEAVIDIHVEFLSTQSVADSLHQYADSVASRFPRREALHHVELLIDRQADLPSSHTASTKQAGWRLFSAANDRIILLQQQGFTYSHLAPYTTWELFSGEGKPLWDSFVKSCKPTKVNRLAVRNINRLKLPAGRVELSDYLRFIPEVPAEFQTISGVLMQVHIPQSEIGQQAGSIVTLGTEASTEPQQQPLVLDIDVFQQGSWDPSDPLVWEQLGRLRDKKNELFEACITDATRRLFA